VDECKPLPGRCAVLRVKEPRRRRPDVRSVCCPAPRGARSAPGRGALGRGNRAAGAGICGVPAVVSSLLRHVASSKFKASACSGISELRLGTHPHQLTPIVAGGPAARGAYPLVKTRSRPMAARILQSSGRMAALTPFAASASAPARASCASTRTLAPISHLHLHCHHLLPTSHLPPPPAASSLPVAATAAAAAPTTTPPPPILAASALTPACSSRRVSALAMAPTSHLHHLHRDRGFTTTTPALASQPPIPLSASAAAPAAAEHVLYRGPYIQIFQTLLRFKVIQLVVGPGDGGHSSRTHVIGCIVTQGTRVRYTFDDDASHVCQAWRILLTMS